MDSLHDDSQHRSGTQLLTENRADAYRLMMKSCKALCIVSSVLLLLLESAPYSSISMFALLFPLLLHSGRHVQAFDNGVGRLPVMGYDTFNWAGCDYNQTSAYAQASALNNSGFVDLGYNIFILDDCYTLRDRNTDGNLVADPAKFPDGLKNWTNAINAMGIEGGAYTDNGWYTCAGYPGAYGNEVRDLETFRSWGWKYIKYDNCYIPFDNVTQQNLYGRFERMADAISRVASKYNEEPFIYSLCEWGWENPYVWARRYAQAWRINGDIKPYWSSIASIIDQASFSSWGNSFYAHNDMDILEVGNTGKGSPPGNLTFEESKSHFTAWALLKSPLIIGTDVSASLA